MEYSDRPILVRTEEPGDGRQVCVYRVAGRELHSLMPVSSLAPWRVDQRSRQPDNATIPRVNFPAETLVFDGEGTFYNGIRRVRAWWNQQLVRIDIDDEEQVIVDLDSLTIWLGKAEIADGSVLSEILLGPALLLILAAQDTWCLHSSCIISNDVSVAFCGESGMGKSTIAKDAGDDWVRAADDLLPLRFSDMSTGPVVEACLEYPQLKLSNSDQYVDLEKPFRPLAAIFRMMPEDEGGSVSVMRLSNSDALIQFVRHTVSGKLFGSELLKAHIATGKKVVRNVPVYELNFPREMARLDEVRDLVRETVAGL